MSLSSQPSPLEQKSPDEPGLGCSSDANPHALCFLSPAEFIRSAKTVFGAANEAFLQKSSSHIMGFKWAAKELGITVSTEGKTATFSKLGTPIGGLSGMLPSIVKRSAVHLCRDKCQTVSFLRKRFSFVPESQAYSLDQQGYRAALTYWKATAGRFGIVVKPSHGSGGKGVTVGVANEGEFAAAWRYAASNATASNCRIMLEEQLRGCDFRVIVVDGEFVCASTRVPAYIVGDGSHTINELIKQKNAQRLKHPHHRRFAIPLLDTGHHRIPARDEIVMLSRTANIHQGGEAFDTTNFVPEEVIYIAKEAVKAIPGLHAAGVDIISDGHQNAKLIEINTSPNFGIHYFPMYGRGRNPAKPILERMMADHLESQGQEAAMAPAKKHVAG